jgi:hypothetical protein
LPASAYIKKEYNDANWRVRIGKTTPLGPQHQIHDLWVVCTLSKSKGSREEKIRYRYYTAAEGWGSEVSVITAKIDYASLWDGFGDHQPLGRFLVLWTSHFGEVQDIDDYKKAPFTPGKSSGNLGNTPRSTTTSQTVDLARSGDQRPQPSLFNDCAAMRIRYGDDGHMVCFLLGDRPMSEEELHVVAASMQEWRNLRVPPSTALINELLRYKIEESQYGSLMLNYEPYMSWERLNRVAFSVGGGSSSTEDEHRLLDDRFDKAKAAWGTLQ